MNQINFRVLNNPKNVLTAKDNGIHVTSKGRYINISIHSLEFPYLQGNVQKIKKAMGFTK